MAELRRREDQMYVDRTGTEDVRGEVFFDDDERSIQNLNPSLDESSIQSSNRPRLVPAGDSTTALFSTADVGDLRQRWSSVQTGFVDEPRWAVQEADKLVATVVERLTEGFANERSSLEKQWDRGEDVSTEDLRLALQRYRAFFDRLLNV
jgi:hypothetical protein